MRILSLSLLFFTSVSLCTAQWSFGSYKKEYYKKFEKNETVVALTDDQSLNEKLKSAVKRYWDFGEYKFVEADDIEKYNDHDKYNLLSFISISENYGSSHSLSSGAWAVYLPGYDINYTAWQHILAYSPIDMTIYGGETTGKDHELSDVEYKMDILIKNLVDVLHFMKDERYNNFQVGWDGIALYHKKFNKANHDKVALARKPLLVNEDDLSQGVKVKDLEKALGSKYKIVSNSEFEKLVELKSEDYNALMLVNVPSTKIYIYDLSNERILYLHEKVHYGVGKCLRRAY